MSPPPPLESAYGVEREVHTDPSGDVRIATFPSPLNPPMTKRDERPTTHCAVPASKTVEVLDQLTPSFVEAKAEASALLLSPAATSVVIVKE